MDVVASEGGGDAENGGNIVGCEPFASGALVLYAALMEEEQTVAVLPRHVEVVDDEEDGLVLLVVDATQEVEYLELVGDVEVGNGLVEEQYGGLLCQCTGYHDALQLAAAHLVGFGEAEVPCVGLT